MKLKTGWVCTWFSYICSVVFSEVPILQGHLDWKWNGFASKRSVVIVETWGALCFSRGGGDSSLTPKGFEKSTQRGGFEHQATPSLKATHWILVWWMYMETTVKLALTSIQHYFSGAGWNSFIAFNFKWRVFQFIFLLVNGKHLHQPVWLISSWINPCFHLCQLMTAEFCPSNMPLRHLSKPFWYSIMLGDTDPSELLCA